MVKQKMHLNGLFTSSRIIIDDRWSIIYDCLFATIEFSYLSSLTNLRISTTQSRIKRFRDHGRASFGFRSIAAINCSSCGQSGHQTEVMGWIARGPYRPFSGLLQLHWISTPLGVDKHSEGSIFREFMYTKIPHFSGSSISKKKIAPIARGRIIAPKSPSKSFDVAAGGDYAS